MVEDKRRTVVVLLSIALLVLLETGLYAKWARQPVVSGPPAAMPASEALAYINSTPDALVIDVRTNKEYSGTQLPQSINIPLYAVTSSAASLPADRPIIIRCTYGLRSRQAYKVIRRLRPDITNIRYVNGQMFTPDPPEKM